MRAAEAARAGGAENGSARFADRLAALVSERRSQVCLGLDPVPATLPKAAVAAGHELESGSPAERAAIAVEHFCRSLIAAAGPACVAIKPQVACFERLGAPGWTALTAVIGAARKAGLLVIADVKRGDVSQSAAAYADAILGSTPSPWGDIAGLGADAATVNPLMGRDSLEPWIERAEANGAGLFALVRTSNPGAADVLDLDVSGAPLYEAVARMLAGLADRLDGEAGLSGLGAVVGATRPEHIARIRELLPRSVFLLPGVGAQGGSADALADAFAPGPASGLVTASRSIAGAEDPGAEADRLRAQAWSAASRGAGLA
ncbi:orotidine-5'-phosphate decarboxylase [Thermoleophilia bacterium SCSIO 60948]|nr:orotidine-5'-phosphate decarboxylase [Thermoleophilia bacterium SCSIO 60948]